VLDGWDRWADKKRGFRAFCEHVWFHLRVPFGRQHIKDILQAHGVRIPTKRGRPPDASANRGGFQTFHPGAQWVGDGAELVVMLNGQRFTVNLELLVDADSGAFTGASIRPTEDAAAVTEAFADGVRTTGAPPVALLLDNKPSNHGEEVDQALGDTLLHPQPALRPNRQAARRGRLRPLRPGGPAHDRDRGDPRSPRRRDRAPRRLRLVCPDRGRVVNQRPRADRDGKTHAQLYRDAEPTAEEIAQARAALEERRRKQDKAREARRRRQDPVVRALLDAAFARLGLDPVGRTTPKGTSAASSLPGRSKPWSMGSRSSRARRRPARSPRAPTDATSAASSRTSPWRPRAGTSPKPCSASASLPDRRDLTLAHLERHKDAIEEDDPEPIDLTKAFVDKALASARGIDRTYWLLATADVIGDQEPADQRLLLRLAARRIHSTFAVPHAQRLAATRFLFAKVVVID